jgi:mannosyltransferase
VVAQRWLLLALATMGTLCGLGIRNYYANFAKEDWDKVTQWVAAEAAPQELVLFNASWTVLPFDYYYTHFEKRAPALVYHGMPADLFDAGLLEPPMTEAAVPRLLSLIQDQQAVWLVYSHWWYTDPNGVLLRALDTQMVRVEEREWPGIRVIRYARR